MHTQLLDSKVHFSISNPQYFEGKQESYTTFLIEMQSSRERERERERESETIPAASCVSQVFVQSPSNDSHNDLPSSQGQQYSEFVGASSCNSLQFPSRRVSKAQSPIIRQIKSDYHFCQDILHYLGVCLEQI